MPQTNPTETVSYSAADLRVVAVTVRMFKFERDQLMLAAAAEGLSQQEFCKRAIFDSTMNVAQYIEEGSDLLEEAQDTQVTPSDVN